MLYWNDFKKMRRYDCYPLHLFQRQTLWKGAAKVFIYHTYTRTQNRDGQAIRSGMRQSTTANHKKDSRVPGFKESSEIMEGTTGMVKCWNNGMLETMLE